jgi:calcineurin-like phosphoesterase family protein
MSETFFLSDHHLGHPKILTMPARPFATLEEMAETIISNHNSVVPTDGICWWLGDAALGDRMTILRAALSRMNGRHRLVTGNHDTCFLGSTKGVGNIRHYMDVGFEVVVPFAQVKLPPTRYDRPGRKVMLSHFPYDGDSRGEDRHTGARLRDEGEPLIHGHVHNEYTVRHSAATGAIQINVAVERWNFTPVNAHTLARLFDAVEAGEQDEF